MHEFVQEQVTTRGRAGREPSSSEDHMVANGVGASLNRARRLGGLSVGVHPYMSEVVPESLFGVAASRGGQRDAG
jgi:hypothetical protein